MSEAHAAPLADPTATCGNCGWGRVADPANLQMRECCSLPPIPCVLGGAPDGLGRMHLNVEVMRPMVPANMPACSLWKRKAQLIIGAARAD